MSEELGAVLEAPAEEVVEEVTPAAEPVEPVVDDKEPKGDERTMPQWMRNLKATDSAAFKEAKAIFFGKRSMDEKLKDFDLDGTKAFLDEHGGRDGLATALTELQEKAVELDDISSKLVNDPAALVEDILSVAPDSIGRLAEAAYEKWAQADPEGWGAKMSGVMAATIQQNGIPLFLERMGLMLEVGKTDQIPAMIKQLQEWAGSFQAKASAPRTNSFAKQPDKNNEREQQLNQREEKAFSDDMKRDVDGFRTPLITKELDSFIKRRPNDVEAKELAISTVRSQVIERMSNDAAFQKSLNALTVRKDKEGAMRLIKSRETAAITEIAPKVGRTIFGNPAAAKAADTKPVTKTAIPSKITGRVDPRDSIFERILAR